MVCVIRCKKTNLTFQFHAEAFVHARLDQSHQFAHLTGGCAAMPGMDLAIHRETGLRVTVAYHPRDCVIHGVGCILKEPSLWGTRLDYRIK